MFKNKSGMLGPTRTSRAFQAQALLLWLSLKWVNDSLFFSIYIYIIHTSKGVGITVPASKITVNYNSN
jgi:hypothetical protein